MRQREKLFTIDSQDLRVETFTAGGPGGQHQNKTASAVRITHLKSGARGESRSERSQHRNKRIALQRLAESPEFKSWVRVEASARLSGYANMDRKIDDLMDPRNLKIEYYTPENG